MDKKIVVVGIVAVLLLTVGLSGCTRVKEKKFMTLPDGTKVYGDFDELEILTYSVVTEKAINYTSWIYATTYEKIADGLIYSKDASRYRVNVTVKNIAGEPLDRITIFVRYYDNIDNLLHSDYDYEYDLYTGDTTDLSFTWSNYSSPSYFKQADHISFKLSA